MPALKQPPPLQDLTMKVLVNFFYWFCQRGENDPDGVSQNVSSMKTEINARYPQKLASKFYNKLLEEVGRSGGSFRGDLMAICVKIVMDETIIGLDCTWRLLDSLRPEDAHRVRGINRLELKDETTHSLDNFHLEHLTVFKFQYGFTDSTLRVIVDNCPKLEHVDVTQSAGVTDVGLAALASCPQLKTLWMSSCTNVTVTGVNRFLAVNQSIRRLSASSFINTKGIHEGFDFSLDMKWEDDPSVCDSLESFTIGIGFSNQHLLHVVKRFPNLRSIKICPYRTVDLSLLKSLSKLSEIDFVMDAGTTWVKFGSLLDCVGPQIVKLKVFFKNCSVMRRGVESIFQLCKNLESLEIFSQSEFDEEPCELVVPPFVKLKEFKCDCLPLSRLAFGEMSKLEYLFVTGFPGDVSQVESIVDDQTRFPNLKVFRLKRFWRLRMDDLHRLRQIVKTKNLDLDIGDSW